MITLDTLQRSADHWAAKLGVGPVQVRWADDCPGLANGHLRLGSDLVAHCHIIMHRGAICVHGRVAHWGIGRMSRLMRHEVAHLVGKGQHGTREFMKAAGEKKQPAAPWRYQTATGRPVAVPDAVHQALRRARVSEIVEIRRTA